MEPAHSHSRTGESAKGSRRSGWDEFVLWLAQGFGSGRAPRGPGTFGSLVGLGWLALLLATGSPAWFLAGALSGVGVAVWACGRAERILGRHDPGSVVLDEIVAMPLCFAFWIFGRFGTAGFPDVRRFLEGTPWWVIPLVFLLFRLFDIWKPWPIRRAQHLPGGWGVVADDLLAAAWTNGVGFLIAGRF